MRTLFFALIFLFSINLSNAFAQEILSLETAIQEALENNYNIKVTEIQKEIAQNNFTKGNSGLMPQITGTAGVTYSNNNTQFEFATGDTQSRNNAFSLGTNASIALAYTIYAGKTNKLNYQRFQTVIEQSEVQTRQAVENTLTEVFRNYYEVARLTEEYKVAQEAIIISQDRIKRAESRNEYGAANSLEILNAQVDLNADSLNAVTAFVNLENAKRNLCLTMTRPMDTNFEVNTEVAYIFEKVNVDALVEEALENNVNFALLNYNKKLLEQDLSIVNAGQAPRVDFNVSYGFNRNQTDAGFVLANRSYGLNSGITVNIPIYDGYQRRIREQNTQVNIKGVEIQQKQLEEQITRDLSNAFALYENALYVLQMQERNLEIAAENFRQTQEKFDYGQLNTTQFREAQLNLIRAKSSLNNAKFAVALTEVELIRLIGSFK